MKTVLMTLVMLMLSGIATAADSLKVRFFPDTRLFAEGLPIPVEARANGENLVYRFVLERFESGRYAGMREWTGDSEIRLAADSGVLPPGKYRLVTRVSEGAGQPEIMVRNAFRVIGRFNPDFRKVSQMNQIERDFDLAVTAIRWELATVRKK